MDDNRSDQGEAVETGRASSPPEPEVEARPEPSCEPPAETEPVPAFEAAAAPVVPEPAVAEAAPVEPAPAGEGGEPPPPPPPPEPPLDPLRMRVLLLERELAEKQAQLHDYIRAHKKAKADFDAYRERLTRDQDKQADATTARLVTSFLEVADNLERMLDAALGSASPDALREGVQLVHRQLHQKLAELGLERHDPQGKAFDPTHMEALGVVPVEDQAEDNTVIRTLQPGYRLKGRELRPARVQVGRKKA
jgi:molecular chaperone GrpE (heat shock protein)